MEKPNTQRTPSTQDMPQTPPPAAERQSWQEPTLAFVEPTLTAHGELTKITGQEGFFGGFTP